MQSMQITHQGARALMVRTAKNYSRFVLRGQTEQAALADAKRIVPQAFSPRRNDCNCEMISAWARPCYRCEFKSRLNKTHYGMFMAEVQNELYKMRRIAARDGCSTGPVCELGSGAKLYHSQGFHGEPWMWHVSGYAQDGSDVKVYSRYAMDRSLRLYAAQPDYRCFVCRRVWLDKEAVHLTSIRGEDELRCSWCHSSLTSL